MTQTYDLECECLACGYEFWEDDCSLPDVLPKHCMCTNCGSASVDIIGAYECDSGPSLVNATPLMRLQSAQHDMNLYWAELDALVAMSSHGQGVLCNINPPQPLQGVYTMSISTKLVENKTLVLGNDIKTMSVEQLVSTIKTLEKESVELSTIQTPSAKLDKRKAEIAETLTVVAAELDAR